MLRTPKASRLAPSPISRHPSPASLCCRAEPHSTLYFRVTAAGQQQQQGPGVRAAARMSTEVEWKVELLCLLLALLTQLLLLSPTISPDKSSALLCSAVNQLFSSSTVPAEYGSMYCMYTVVRRYHGVGRDEKRTEV